MNINLIKNNKFNFDKDLIILPCYEDELISFKKLDIPNDVLKSANDIIKNKTFDCKMSSKYYYNMSLDNNVINILLLGMGKKDKINLKNATVSFVDAVNYAIKLNMANIYLALRPINDIDYNLYITTVVRSLFLSDYKFDKYQSKKDDKTNSLINIIINQDMIDDVSYIVDNAKDEADCIIYTRNLVNEPANVLTPEVLSEKAKESAKNYGYTAEIFDENQIKQLGMNAYLEVAKGSDNPPKLIVLRYKGNADDDKIYGLVGKGLCYDSGGYSIKPTDSMLDMKSDMGGAATVIGAMNIIAKRKLKINVTAVIASCENMISGGAYKPGDIITSMDNTHIEVNNTDAEGRLTLADAITYSIEKENVAEIIELSTLTGAVLIALGSDITGAITKYDYMYEDLKAISKETLDEIWQLPYHEDYQKMIKSEVADIKNSAGRYAGSITAGLFVTKFAKDTPIIHLDIAGSAFSEKSNPICPKGGTGASVLMLYKYYEKKSK